MIPKITFEPLDLEETAYILAWSLFETEGPIPLRTQTLKLYPNLEDLKKQKNYQETIDEIIKKIYSQYEIDENTNKKLAKKYQKIWDKYNDEYMKIISNILEIKWPEDTKKIIGKVGNLPVCPRYIKERLFYIDHNTEEEIIDTCMHECCHFLFFEKCKEIFVKWKWEDFDNPSILWYVSEILIDPLLNSNKIQKLFEHKFRGYDIFYTVNIKNEPLMETIKNIIETNTITDAIIKSCNYLKENEQEFRSKCNK